MRDLIFKKLIYLIEKYSSVKYRKNTPKLPELLFLIGTIFFPQLNVELIIRDKNEKTFYLWRDDEFGNNGWHLPGGIIRPNEKILKRVEKVIIHETNININNVKIHGPIAFSEVIHKSPGIRSHFNSFVFLVEFSDFLDDEKNIKRENILITKKIPKNIINNHKRYIPLLSRDTKSLIQNKIEISK